MTTFRILATVSLVLAIATPVGAQDRLDEYQVKAAFLFNFAKFVQWPAAAPSGPLVACVIGEDRFADVLEQTVEGKTAQGRTVLVRRPKHDEDLGSCHIAFIGSSEERRTPELLQRLQAAPVLTMGETVHFLRESGAVRFYVERNRVRFQINPAGAEQVGLKIHSQLLSLAKQQQ